MAVDEDPEAQSVYRAEEAALVSVPLRRFRRFAEIERYVETVTVGTWWATEFPDAPLEVTVERRSRNATWSAAATAPGDIALVALVDGHGWGLETVLHELSHIAVGPGAGHGVRFRRALLGLWRHEAGVQGWAALRASLVAEGIDP